MCSQTGLSGFQRYWTFWNDVYSSILRWPLLFVDGAKSSQNTFLAFLASRPLYEISTNINVQLEVTSNPGSWKPAPRSGTFLGPPESVGERPAGRRLPPRSASDERFCSLASHIKHESSTANETGNRYEQVCQMCKYSLARKQHYAARIAHFWLSSSITDAVLLLNGDWVFINILT